MEMVQITQEQAQLVMQALDAAIRAGGANSALVILPLMQEIQKQLKQQ